MLESLGQLIVESLVTAIIVAGFLKIVPFEWERRRKEQYKKDEEREKWLNSVKSTLIDMQNNKDKIGRDPLNGSVPHFVDFKIQKLNEYTQDYFATEYDELSSDLHIIHNKLVEISEGHVDDEDQASYNLIERTESVVEEINDELDKIK